jgi:hypothetical protein
MTRKLLSSDQARPANGHQHTRPCSDCPLRKDSLSGWLGDGKPAEWIEMLHGETRIECHTLAGAQCAGAAIYRTNVAKLPRDRSLLRLVGDRVGVFTSPQQFLEHHEHYKENSG